MKLSYFCVQTLEGIYNTWLLRLIDAGEKVFHEIVGDMISNIHVIEQQLKKISTRRRVVIKNKNKINKRR